MYGGTKIHTETQKGKTEVLSIFCIDINSVCLYSKDILSTVNIQKFCKLVKNVHYLHHTNFQLKNILKQR